MSRSALLRYFESFFRRRWLFLAPFAIAIIAGIAYFLLAPTKYTSQGVLFTQENTYLNQLLNVQTSNGPNFVSMAKSTSDEVNDLIKTDAFIRATIQETPLEAKMSGNAKSVDQLILDVRKAVNTTPQVDSQVFVTATWNDPTVSIKLANSIIDNYIRWKTNTQRTDTQAAASFLASIITQYTTELNNARQSLQDYLNAHPAPLRGDRSGTETVEIDKLQKDIDLASTRLNDALDKSETARLTAETTDSSTKSTYIIIDSPRVPQSGITSRTSKGLISLVILAVGLLVSLGGVLVNHIFDHGFYTPAEVRERTALPVLAVFPDARRIKRKQKKEARSQPRKNEVGRAVSAD